MIGSRETGAVVLDIEGTTSSLSFVQDTLYPFARRHLPAYVRDHEAVLADILDAVRTIEGNAGLDTPEIINVLLRWMDEDRKITPLKTLQGIIWRQGYASGELRAHVYDDAARALQKWHASGVKIYVYSSGSVVAQQLLFANSAQGDLTPCLAGYFDTTVGSKLEAGSYTAIGTVIGLSAQAILFLSDHPGEIRAAAAAGMQAILVDRQAAAGACTNGNRIRSFDDLALQPLAPHGQPS